jgi:hypothetical protein
MTSVQVFKVSTMTATVLTTDIGTFRVWPNGSIEVKNQYMVGGDAWVPFTADCYEYDVPAILRQAAREEI